MHISYPGKKNVSVICMIAGGALVVLALAMSFMNTENSMRGVGFITGLILFFAGLYLFPAMKNHRKIVNVIFLFPLLFAFLVTVVIPLLLGIGYSFTDWDGIRMERFTGIANYVRMFRHPGFLWSAVLTSLFAVLNIVLVNLVAFGLALICTSDIKGADLFKAAYFLPNLIGGIVLGYIWQFIFSDVFIVITREFTYRKYSMLAETRTAFIGIIIVYIWQYAGYIMLIYIAGLKGIPDEVLEAAAIDGASDAQTLFEIKVPMIAPTMTVCTFLTLTSAFKQFDVNLALTSGTGSVADFMGNYITNGTEMLALNIYDTAVVNGEYALGQAKSVLFFIILAAVSVAQVRISKRWEDEE